MTRKVDDPGKLSAEEVDKVNKAYTAAVNKLLSHPNQTVTVPVNGKSAEYKAGDLAKRLANPVVDKKAVAGQDSTSDTVKISVPNNAQSLIQGHLTTDEGPETTNRWQRWARQMLWSRQTGAWRSTSKRLAGCQPV